MNVHHRSSVLCVLSVRYLANYRCTMSLKLMCFSGLGVGASQSRPRPQIRTIVPTHTCSRLLSAISEHMYVYGATLLPSTMLTTWCFSRYYNRGIAVLSSPEIQILGGIASSLSVICDIIIVAVLCYYLNSKRTGFKRYGAVRMCLVHV